MSNLEAQITEWRRRMAEGGITGVEVLDELEGHLRDDIAAQTGGGAEEAEAFAASVAHLGSAGVLKREFDKVGREGWKSLKNAFLTLAGIPPSHQANAMNTTMNDASPSVEPRWASYAKAALFLTPGIAIWIFSMMFLVPKLQQVTRVAGVKSHWLYDMTLFFADHATLVALVILLPFVLLEWLWSGWARYRRLSVGGAVVLVNAGVMILITLMVIFALVAAPALMQGR